jgi:hypothetical protein
MTGILIMRQYFSCFVDSQAVPTRPSSRVCLREGNDLGSEKCKKSKKGKAIPVTGSGSP